MRFQFLYSGWKPPREDGDAGTIHGILATDCGLGMWDAQTLLGQLEESGGTIKLNLVRQHGYVQIWATPDPSAS